MITDEHFFEALGKLLAEIDMQQLRPKYLEPLYRMCGLWPNEWQNMPPSEQRLWVQSLDLFLNGQPNAAPEVYYYLNETNKHLADSFFQTFSFLRQQRGI